MSAVGGNTRAVSITSAERCTHGYKGVRRKYHRLCVHRRPSWPMCPSKSMTIATLCDRTEWGFKRSVRPTYGPPHTHMQRSATVPSRSRPRSHTAVNRHVKFSSHSTGLSPSAALSQPAVHAMIAQLQIPPTTRVPASVSWPMGSSDSAVTV